MAVAQVDSLQSTLNNVRRQVGVSVEERLYTRYHRAYYYAYLFALVLCWSPSKLIAYLAPWLALGIYFFFARSASSLLRLLALLTTWGLSLPVYTLLTPGFVTHSAFLSLLTYGSFIFVIVVANRRIAGRQLLELMRTIGLWVLAVEGSFGLVQGILAGIESGTFDGTTGDAVAGTIRPFVKLSDFSNPIFAVNIALLLLLLFPSLIQTRKGKAAFVAGVLSLILASVVHVLLFLFAAVTVAIFLNFPSLLLRKQGLLALSLVAVIVVAAVSLLSTNFSTASSFATQTLEVRTPRAQVIQDVFTRIPREYPWMTWIGIGAGQFSSRAGLIGTGMYFGSPANPTSIPLMPTGMSEPFKNYVYELWLQMTFNPSVNDSSSSYKPFFSWLSLYVEWGAIATMLLLMTAVRLLWKIKRLGKSSSQRTEALAVSASIIFIMLLGAQENYWEVSQALFTGLMLLQVSYINLVSRSTTKV